VSDKRRNMRRCVDFFSIPQNDLLARDERLKLFIARKRRQRLLVGSNLPLTNSHRALIRAITHDPSKSDRGFI